MPIRKIVLIVAPLLFLLAATGLPQTSAQSAQKEKEQSEIKKDQKGVVVTNADLAKVKKKPAVSAPKSETPAEVPIAPPGGQTLKISTGTDQPPAGWTPGGSAAGADKNVKNFDEAKKAELEAAWAKAKERVDLLNFKMLSLQRQYDGAFQPAVKEQARKALDETSLKLQDAQAEEKRAKAALDRFSPSKLPRI